MRAPPGGGGANNATCLPLGPGNAGVEAGGSAKAKAEARACRAEEGPGRLCAFTGNLQSTPGRAKIEEAMGRCDVRHSLNLSGSGVVDGAYYSDVVGAKFCLLPGGNNYETFRVYEALEWGACVGVLQAPVPEPYRATLERFAPGFDIEKAFLLCEEWGEECVRRMEGADWRTLREGADRLWERVKREVKAELVAAMAID